MELLSEQLILSILKIVRRDWEMLSHHWQSMFEINLIDNRNAEKEFAMAVLAVALGDEPPPALRQSVHQKVISLLKNTDRDLEKDLCLYESVCSNWKTVSGKYVVPPLEHRHEALGIVFSDAADLRPTITMNGLEIYNLFIIGILGLCITNTLIEVNKHFQSPYQSQ